MHFPLDVSGRKKQSAEEGDPVPEPPVDVEPEGPEEAAQPPEQPQSKKSRKGIGGGLPRPEASGASTSSGPSPSGKTPGSRRSSSSSNVSGKGRRGADPGTSLSDLWDLMGEEGRKE